MTGSSARISACSIRALRLPASVKLTTNTPTRLAGTWDLDATAAGGPVVHVTFDAALVKELKK
jgi:hypothetical protein